MKRIIGTLACLALVVGLAVCCLSFPGVAGGTTKHRPPAGCVRAIMAYAQVEVLAGQGFGIAANYPEQYGPIVEAAANGDATTISGISDKVQGWTSQLQALVPQLNAAEDRALAATKQCLAGR